MLNSCALRRHPLVVNKQTLIDSPKRELEFKDSDQAISESHTQDLFQNPPGLFSKFSELISPETIATWGKTKLDFKIRNLKTWLTDFDRKNPRIKLSDIYYLSPFAVSKLSEADQKGFKQFVRAFANVSPQIIIENFGVKMLLFLYAHYPINDPTKSKLAQELMKSDFSNIKMLDLSLNSVRGKPFLSSLIRAYQMHTGSQLDVLSSTLPYLLNKYKLLNDSDDTKNFSLETIFPASLASGKLKRGRPAEYFSKIIDDKFFSFYLDSPFAIMLKYKNKPAAVVAMNISKDGQTLEIRQIQTISPYQVINGSAFYKDDLGENHYYQRLRPEGLFKDRQIKYDFKKLLVQMAETWAQLYNFKKVMVLSGENNYHIIQRPCDKEPRLDLARARKIYDETALSMGYKQERFGNWFKQVA